MILRHYQNPCLSIQVSVKGFACILCVHNRYIRHNFYSNCIWSRLSNHSISKKKYFRNMCDYFPKVNQTSWPSVHLVQSKYQKSCTIHKANILSCLGRKIGFTNIRFHLLSLVINIFKKKLTFVFGFGS